MVCLLWPNLQMIASKGQIYRFIIVFSENIRLEYCRKH